MDVNKKNSSAVFCSTKNSKAHKNEGVITSFHNF